MYANTIKTSWKPRVLRPFFIRSCIKDTKMKTYRIYKRYDLYLKLWRPIFLWNCFRRIFESYILWV